MTAFTGTYLSPESVVDLTARARRTPMFFEWPKSCYAAITPRGVHVVYILGFEGGIVKVGQTLDFLTRLSGNRSSPHRRGKNLVCGWRVGSDSALEDEDTLKRIAGELGGIRIGRSREWFSGVDVLDLIAAGENAILASH